VRAIETQRKRDSELFAAVCEALLHRGLKVRFRAEGESMRPNILHKDAIIVTSASIKKIRCGEVLLTRGKDGLHAHRVVCKDPASGAVLTRGDSGQHTDLPPTAILGKVIAIERRGKIISLQTPGVRHWHGLRILAYRLVRAAACRVQRVRAALVPTLILLFAFLGQATPAHGQAFSITNTAAPTLLGSGGTVTYTQVITSSGGVAITHPITVTQPLPANTTFVSAAKTAGRDNWTCAFAAPNITCTDTSGGTYPSGRNTTFTIVVTVNAGTPDGTVITDTATVKGANTAQGMATATVTVQTPDISITDAAAPNPVATGANITYTQTATNAGPASAAGATLTENTPANTLFQSITPPAGWTCGTQPAVGSTGAISCTTNANTNFNPGNAVFTLVVSVRPEAQVGSNITNTVTVSENGTDPTPTDNTATATVTVLGADLSMTQTVSAPAVAAGSTITYTETVTNNGPNAAVGVVLYQQTPANTTFSSITPPAGWTCGTQPAVGGTGQVICTATGNVASGTVSGNFVYVVTLNGGTAAGTSIVNNADVNSQTTDPNPSNNVTSSGATVVEVAGDSDMALTMTASPTPVFVNSAFSYTITIQNLGLSAGTGVTVTDTLPGALVNPTATSTQGTCAPPAGGKIVCTLGAVAYPLATPITITVSGTTPALPGTLTNVATVATTPATNDPVAANNSATVLTVVQPLVCATPGKDGAPGTLTGVVNTYYAGVGTAAAGATTLTVATPSSGSATQIGVGDLLLVIQMQDAQINSSNTSSYGDGVPGDPASGSTSLGSSGLFEFVTVTAVTVNANTDTVTISGTGANGGLLNTYITAADTATQGAQTFQVIRVPQYASATLSSTLVALPWNGTLGGVLALDVASQLTLGGTVSLDGQGFRGGGGRNLTGGTGAGTDTVTLSTDATNGSKGEGIAGTPAFIAPPLANITPATTATATGQAVAEGYPNGSYARGAPANAGGGATDADPPANDQNSGGGGGGNGGTGGIGGFGWNSAGLVGGFGGVAFPVSTSALVMGGGGGAGTTNNGSFWNPATDTGGHDCGANCTGIFSSGTSGGGIVIIHAGSLAGTGTISASGQNALETENDGGGGGGAGGTILVFANSGLFTGLTANAFGGNGGITWPEQGPGATFPGNRHGPGGGGGGGVILATAVPGASNVSGGSPGFTNLEKDAYGAAIGQSGVLQSNLSITETPGAQSGAYCAGADLAVTNAGAPNPVTPGANITYTQTVSNAGPQDAVNAAFSEAVPANTTFQSITPPAGWACNSNASILATGTITCSDADVPSGAGGTGTFTVVTQVNAGTTFGTQIVDVANITSGTNDPNLTNNTATVTTIVGSATSAFLSLTKTAASPTVAPGGTITYTLTLHNGGPAAAVGAALTDSVPTNTTFSSFTAPGAWTCFLPPVGGTGNISCTIPSFANGANATFTLVVTVSAAATPGSTISNTGQANSGTPNPDPPAASATANVEVATGTQADLSVTSSASPNPVLAGNNITYTQTVTNIGPASATGVTFTDVLPTGITPMETTFVSLVAPAGWNCVTPAVGAAGTVTCTFTGNGGNFTSGSTASFPLVVKVNPVTPPGTVISNSPTVSATTPDPNAANNTATSTTVVASPTQADVAITKTAAPEPVDQGTNLTYTLQVTNNGPAVAQGVMVSDPLPSQVTFTSVTTTQGTCPTQPAVGASGTVGCNIGTISVGGLVIITINVNAATFSSSTLATNTATVTATTNDPNLTNNSSTVNSTIQAPTAVQLSSFQVLPRVAGGVELVWHTREEIRNLGFHLYREDALGKHRLDPSLISGAALFIRGAQPQHGAKTYRWLDPAGSSAFSYWLEDVDLNGTRTMHGPARLEFSADSAQAAAQTAGPEANSPLLTEMNHLLPPPAVQPSRGFMTPRPKIPEVGPGEVRVSLEEVPAVKISIRSEGWYRVTRSQLVAAGLDLEADTRFLQLFAEGIEQPMLILGPQTADFGPENSIEFYGTGIDTPFSDTRVYWLVKGSRPGKRILPAPSAISGLSEPQSFLFTVIHEDRTTYFATLLNGEDKDNFFGDVVTSAPLDQDLTVAHLDANSSLPATVDVTLQGGTDQQAHSVSVALNGTSIGEMDFNNQANVTNTFPVDINLLHDGTNTVTLTALLGDNDVSVVQSIALHYPHLYAADSNWLRATAAGGSTLHISGFSNPQVHVFDITNPLAILQVSASVRVENQAFGVTFALPGSGAAERTLLAFSEDQISPPTALAHHKPSNLANPREDDDIIIVSHPDFVSSLEPLVRLRASQGHDLAVVTIDQVFDAFNFGERSPFAIRQYLQLAQTLRRRKPQAVLLVGDASLDPRNYEGFGDFDFVPTRIIETQAFKTASDDWFTDFKETGFATIPTGRLPVRTPQEAALAVSKIVNYEKGSFDGAWNQRALLIADANIEVDFTSEANLAGASLPGVLSPTKILADGQDPNGVRQQILSALDNGALLVNYTGHGSLQQWSFADLFDNTSAASLSNGQRLPVYLLMDCLNGFFHDPSAESLAMSLLFSQNGGAVAVWASSGFTNGPPQASMDQAFLQNLKVNPAMPIGKAILGAKSDVTDSDVRRTWILFGDPSMRLQFPKK